MPSTYDSIATTTLGTASATISFTSIPSSYTDLRVVVVGQNPTAERNPLIQFNNDSTSGLYSSISVMGAGSTANSTSQQSANFIRTLYLPFPSTDPGMYTIDIFGYAGSTRKTVLLSSGNDTNGAGTVEYGAGLWRNTAAITSIQLTLSGSTNYSANTMATLYGILRA